MICNGYPNTYLIVGCGTAIVPLNEERTQKIKVGCSKITGISYFLVQHQKPKSCVIYNELVQDDMVITIIVDPSYSFIGGMGAFASKCLNYGLQKFDFLISLGYLFLLCTQLFHVQLKYSCNHRGTCKCKSIYGWKQRDLILSFPIL